MNGRPVRQTGGRRTLWTLAFGFISAAFTLTVLAQVCTPVDSSFRPWQKNSPVSYDTSSLQEPIKSQVEAAVQKWDAANRNNQSGVRFTPSTSSPKLRFRTGATSSGRAGETAIDKSGGLEVGATVTIDPNHSSINSGQPGYDTIFTKIGLHEIGHTMGLDDTPGGACSQQPGNSVMNGICNTNDDFGGVMATDVTGCDQSSVRSRYPQSGGGGGGCEMPPGGCGEGEVWDDIYCLCQISPVIIDTRGDGYRLTDASHGVQFTMRATSPAQQISWTAAGGDEAFIVLDRNGNGSIDDGSELFGSVTPLYPGGPRAENGFEALAALERKEFGRSVPDRIIDRFDAPYRRLRLWIDVNHDGVSEPSELVPLPQAGLLALDTRYQSTSLRDEHGNRFAEVGRAWWRRGGRITWGPYFDVWLNIQ